MKTKDQLVLENIYHSMQDVKQNPPGMSKDEIINSLETELSKSIVGPNTEKYLEIVKNNYNILDVIEHLNTNKNWLAKDNLIQYLFRHYIN